MCSILLLELRSLWLRSFLFSDHPPPHRLADMLCKRKMTNELVIDNNRKQKVSPALLCEISVYYCKKWISNLDTFAPLTGLYHVANEIVWGWGAVFQSFPCFTLLRGLQIAWHFCQYRSKLWLKLLNKVCKCDEENGKKIPISYIEYVWLKIFIHTWNIWINHSNRVQKDWLWLSDSKSFTFRLLRPIGNLNFALFSLDPWRFG